MMPTPTDPPQKVVYVLGAGFSKPAGAPSQDEILGEILQLGEANGRVSEAKRNLREFLSGDLNLDIEHPERIALEDIYTPIDRCIADGTSLKGRTSANLSELREHLGGLISRAISAAIARHFAGNTGSSGYVHDFASYVVAKAARRGALAASAASSALAKGYDPLSIISLNWDILLDSAIHESLFRQCPKQGDYDAFGVVDYCCYVSSLDPGDSRIRPGLWSLGCRGYNVKLLKLHGSLNWLQCPNCQRLFVDFGSKTEILEHVGKTPCRHCGRFGYRHALAGSLVMPTFLKDRSNFQIKLVWQNAGVELLEAKRLVFIGYSLPHADFEFRQLLSRMTHRAAAIDVVLHKESSPQRYDAEVDRYRQFFGRRELTFHPSGVIDFVSSLR
jgi:hypothetical protein